MFGASCPRGRPLSRGGPERAEQHEEDELSAPGTGRGAATGSVRSGRFGVERVAQVLVGSLVREVTERGLERLPTFGKLAALMLVETKDLLARLADSGEETRFLR